MSIKNRQGGGGKQQGKGGGKAQGHRGGKGFGKPGQQQGGWVFVPANVAPMMRVNTGFGKGKGFGKSSFVHGGKGKAKGNDKYKFMDKLDTIDAERKVWVGGLPKDVSRGQLAKHFKEVSNPSIFEIMSKGTACLAFKTAEDAESVITSLNGSEMEGSTIEVDVWTKKEKKERPEGEKREKRQKKMKGVIKTNLKQKPGDSKMKEKLRAVDHSLKAWVGGLSEKTTWKQLKQHFTDNGCEVDLVDLMKKGTAVVTFKTEDEVTSAVGSLNSTVLDDSTIEVDVWTKPERKEKVKKE